MIHTYTSKCDVLIIKIIIMNFINGYLPKIIQENIRIIILKLCIFSIIADK